MVKDMTNINKTKVEQRLKSIIASYDEATLQAYARCLERQELELEQKLQFARYCRKMNITNGTMPTPLWGRSHHRLLLNRAVQMAIHKYRRNSLSI